MVKITVFALLSIFMLSPPAMAQSNLAQVFIDKGFDKIIKPELRKTIRMDIETNSQAFDANQNKKSDETERKTTDGRLDVRGINIDELYHAFRTRYDFYIDMNESTAVINGMTCAVIKFTPKNNLKAQKAADQFINRAEGTIYINIDNFDIVRIEGGIKKPFRFSIEWLFFRWTIDVYGFDFLVEYTTFNNMLVEDYVAGMADYEYKKRTIEKFTNKITNYRLK